MLSQRLFVSIRIFKSLLNTSRLGSASVESNSEVRVISHIALTDSMIFKGTISRDLRWNIPHIKPRDNL